MLLFSLGVLSQTPDFNVQQVEDDVARTGGINTSFSAVSSLSSAVALANSNRKSHAGRSDLNAGTLESDDMSGARVLTGTNTLTYYRESNSTNNDMRFNTSIWEYVGTPGGANEMIVRGRYAVSLNGGTNNVTQALSGIINTDDCIPFITGILNDSSADDADSGTAIAYLDNASTLRVLKGSNDNDVTVYVTVVEFTGSNWTVHHGDSGTSSADSGNFAIRTGSSGVGTTSAVSNWSNAVIFSHHIGNTASSGMYEAIADNWPIMDPSSVSSVDWTFHGDHNANNSVRHFVHVLENSDMNVTRYQDTSNSDDESTIDISSAGLSDINQAMIVGSSTSSGTGTAYGRGWRNYYLNSTTEAAHWSHRSGNTMSHEIQIIDFANMNTSTYCTSSGYPLDGYNTGIRLVDFNTIYNATPDEDNGYSDFTSISTTVSQSATYNLSVYVNTDSWSSFFYSLTNTYVWIDWNQDNDFDDAGEEYFLGTADDSTNEATSLSPFAITVPASATIGSTRMRISTKHYQLDAMPESCDTDFTGEVEDYTINIIEDGSLYCDSYGDTVYNTGISLVDFNTISNASDIALNAYSDFTAISTNVSQGSIQNLTINLNTDGDYSVYAMVWIDWNQDGDFNDANEEYDLGFSSDTNGPSSLSALSITVPPGATIGSTRMRVSAKWDGSEDNDGAEDLPPTSCETGFDGEVEDYSINVTAGVFEPEINIVGNTVSIVNNDVTPSTTDDTDFGSIQVASGSDVHTFTIENNGLTDLTSIVVSISGDTGDFTLDTSSTTGTVSSGGTTTFTVTFDPTITGTRTAVISIANDDSDENPYIFNIEGNGSLYCESYGNTDNDMGISRVTIGSINNASSTSTATYSDYTAMSTSIEQGASEDITVKIDTDGHYSLFATVWIDWNQDGDFDDTDESHNVGYAHNGDENTNDSPYSIVVPVAAVVGNTRMRITSKWVGSSNEFHDGDYDPNDPEEYRPSFDPCETGLDGDVEDYTITVTARTPMIDFDGSDDYIDFGDSHDLTGSFSIEAWVLQEQTVTNGTILSKGDLDSSDGSKDYGYVLAVEDGEVTFNTFNNGGQSTVELSSSPYTITNDKWHHVAVSYNGTNAILYIDGILIDSDGTNSSLMNNSESFYIGAYYDSDSVNPVNYFNGFIDEVRIWDIGLTQLQIQEMMNQEIEQNGSGVRGKITTKDISNGLDWTNLIGYYNFNDDSATDQSDSGIDGLDVNITTSELQTAPLPYFTMQDGNWDVADSTTPWQYRETVWNTPNGVGIDGSTNIDWNIVRISHNLNVNRDLYLGSLISESTALITDEEITDSELTIGSDGNDYELNISWYLKLDGKIDLQNESQLIQGNGSWLDVDSSGYIERDQQGTANSYTYNYWSSPVSLRNTTENNKEHKLGDVLRDGHLGSDVINSLDFDPDSSSSIDPYYADGAASSPRKAATYWMYKFVNSQENDYTNWEWVGNYYDINPTEGYTMKGTSGAGSIDMGVETQNFVFRGKPNNVLNNATELVHTSFTASFDNNGNPKISLAGNPFPSAIDADLFIDDNINSINGQIYFWEHWGGGTHKWAQYQGGYSIYTKAGGVAAVSHPNVSQVGSGSKTPERYIPIGQGFYVIQRHDVDGSNIPTTAYGGDVVFNNNQRIFKTEASGESIFTKESVKKSGKSVTIKETKDKVKRIRIGFTSPDGFYRSNMIAFLDGATDNFDNGYDAIAGDFLKNDGFFSQDNRYQVIQAFGEFDREREIPMTIFIDENGQGGIQSFNLEAIENFDQNLKVYIKDKHNNGETYDLSSGNFEVNLEPGEHKERFSVVFQSKLVDLESLSKIEESVTVFMNNDKSQMHIEKIADIDITQVTLHNALGQSMISWSNNLEGRSIRLPVSVSTGVYIISLETEVVGIISKKVLIK